MAIPADSARPLGRNKPPDWRHIALFPATDLPEIPKKVPVPVGFEWYTGMDRVVKGADGIYRVNEKHLGSVRGGHCFCMEPEGEPDAEVNWIFYDQALEPACVGFGLSRAMTLQRGKLRDGFWLYDDARRKEGAYPDGEGSTVRSGGKALVSWGDHYEGGEVIAREPWRSGAPGDGISAYHWLTDVDQIRTALGYGPEVGEFPFLNSWGRDGYPHRVRMSETLLARLLNEEGEAAVLVV